MHQAKIKAIRKYLSHNGVKYYDVQAELIDHFASAVERIERENPEIRFKVALLRAHRSFGGREGFRKYIEQAEKNVHRQTWKMVGLTLLQFLKWPYLLATAAIATSWHFIITLEKPDFFITLLSFSLAYLLVMLANYFRLQRVNMFLPRKANYALGWIFYWICYIPGYSITFGTEEVGYLYQLVYFSFLSLNLFAFHRVPVLAIRETRKLYPKIA